MVKEIKDYLNSKGFSIVQNKDNDLFKAYKVDDHYNTSFKLYYDGDLYTIEIRFLHRISKKCKTIEETSISSLEEIKNYI